MSADSDIGVVETEKLCKTNENMPQIGNIKTGWWWEMIFIIKPKSLSGNQHRDEFVYSEIYVRNLLIRRSSGGKHFNNPHEDTKVEEVTDDRAMEVGQVGTFGNVRRNHVINCQYKCRTQTFRCILKRRTNNQMIRKTGRKQLTPPTW